jgi:hypothetical protein
MRKYSVSFISFILTLAVSLSACYYDSEEKLYPGEAGGTCDTTNVTFSSTVLPILSTNCNACHNSIMASGGVVTENHAGLIGSINSGIFWKAINHEPGAIPMPQNGMKLPACELVRIRTWLNQGAPNN